MESKRQQKIARLIQRDLSEILQKMSSSNFGGVLITVSSVSVTPDLGLARVYLSFMLSPKKEEVLESIKAHKSEIRYTLGKRVRNQLRTIPELEFFGDESFDEAARMDQIISGLDIPPAEEDDEEDTEES